MKYKLAIWRKKKSEMLTQNSDFFLAIPSLLFTFFSDFWVYILKLCFFFWHYRMKNKNGKCDDLSHNSDFFLNYFQNNESYNSDFSCNCEFIFHSSDLSEFWVYISQFWLWDKKSNFLSHSFDRFKQTSLNLSISCHLILGHTIEKWKISVWIFYFLENVRWLSFLSQQSTNSTAYTVRGIKGCSFISEET